VIVNWAAVRRNHLVAGAFAMLSVASGEAVAPPPPSPVVRPTGQVPLPAGQGGIDLRRLPFWPEEAEAAVRPRRDVAEDDAASLAALAALEDPDDELLGEENAALGLL